MAFAPGQLFGSIVASFSSDAGRELFSLLVTRFTSSVAGYTAVLLGTHISRSFLTGLPGRVTGVPVAAPQRSGFALAPGGQNSARDRPRAIDPDRPEPAGGVGVAAADAPAPEVDCRR
ncbi:MAG: hypothetical protein ACLQUY_12720 [Ktedonobacterales bacterium]